MALGTGLIAGSPGGTGNPALVTVPTPGPARKVTPLPAAPLQTVETIMAPWVTSGSSPASLTIPARAHPGPVSWQASAKAGREPFGKVTGTGSGNWLLTSASIAARVAAAAHVPVVQPRRRLLAGRSGGGACASLPASSIDLERVRHVPLGYCFGVSAPIHRPAGNTPKPFSLTTSPVALFNLSFWGKSFTLGVQTIKRSFISTLLLTTCPSTRARLLFTSKLAAWSVVKLQRNTMLSARHPADCPEASKNNAPPKAVLILYGIALRQGHNGFEQDCADRSQGAAKLRLKHIRPSHWRCVVRPLSRIT